MRTSDFRRVYRGGRRRASERFIVVGKLRGEGPARFGITVKARLGGAVVRNRMKRRIRELLRRVGESAPAGWDVVVEPRSAAVARAKFADLEAELKILLAQL